jgi:hypothetical protein
MINVSNALLTRTVAHDVEIEIEGETLADLFWQMGSDEQARFFNKLGSFDRLVFQLQSVSDENLSQNARYAMARIGEYAEEASK